MTWWSVNVEALGDEAALASDDERLVELAAALERHSPAVSSAPGRYGARISVEAPSASRAVASATRHVQAGARKVGLPPWPVVRAEAVAEAELERELDQPTYPQLLGVAEVAKLLGTSRQRVSALARQRGGLPAPVAVLGSGPVWSAATVRRFIDEWDRRPGRPRRASAS